MRVKMERAPEGCSRTSRVEGFRVGVLARAVPAALASRSEGWRVEG